MAKAYITHDSNARNSKKMLRMREKLGPIEGPAAYGIYWMLIERLREEDGYISDKDYEMLAFDLRCDKELLRKVVEDFDLFHISLDGKNFKSDGLEERMELMETRSKAGKKGADKRWKRDAENPNRMAKNGKTEDLPNESDSKSDGIILNKIKINNNNTFSLNPSSAEKLTEEEMKEKILFYFVFVRNWASPEKEYSKFIAFYNNPLRKKKWSQMSDTARAKAIMNWEQEPPADPRFAENFKDVWQSVYEASLPIAPIEVRLDFFHDGVNGAIDGKVFRLVVSARLHQFLEEHLDIIKPILFPFVVELGCQKLVYKHIKQ